MAGVPQLLGHQNEREKLLFHGSIVKSDIQWYILLVSSRIAWGTVSSISLAPAHLLNVEGGCCQQDPPPIMSTNKSKDIYSLGNGPDRNWVNESAIPTLIQQQPYQYKPLSQIIAQ
jgi:hypothetical protein